jgi:hypothetical protein
MFGGTSYLHLFYPEDKSSRFLRDAESTILHDVTSLKTATSSSFMNF